jgi:hypothetical protein
MTPQPVQDAWARAMIDLHSGYIGDVRSIAGSDLATSVAQAIADATTAATNAATALTLANNAQTTANGRNTVMYAASAPTVHPDGTALIAGDLWYQTSAGNIIGVYQRGVSSWTNLPIANQAIFANIDAGKITTGTLSAINLIGNFIETQANVGTGSSPSVVTGVLINSSGNLFCYANTGPVLSFVASTGALTLLGTLTVTGTISLGGNFTMTSGSLFKTSSSNPHIEISSSGGADHLTFVTSTGNLCSISTLSSSRLSVNGYGGLVLDGGLGSTSITGSNGISLGGSGAGISLMDSIITALTAVNDVTIHGSSTNPFVIDNIQSGGATGNMFIGSLGTVAKITSSRRYKKQIRDLNKVFDPRDVLNMRPVAFRTKGGNRHVDPGDDAAGIGERDHVGFIAEEVHELGLTQFVLYDEQGRPDGVIYDRIVVALLAVVRDLKTQVEEIAT